MTYNSDMFVDGIDTGAGIFFVQWTPYDFFNSQHNTILTTKTN